MNHLISFEEYTNESMQGFNNKYLEKIKFELDSANEKKD